jgi:predicted RNA-binding Zn ribbon-like protein
VAEEEFLLLGDALWLEFVNTADSRGGDQDALADPAAYLRWTRTVRLAPPQDLAAFEEAQQLRGKLVAMAAALDAGRSPPPSGIEAINRLLIGLDGQEQLVRIGGHWQVRFQALRPPTALEAIARSAAETLASPVTMVRRCANGACGLYFADDTPSQSRRWCSRTRCGQSGPIERRRNTPRPTPLVTEG